MITGSLPFNGSDKDEVFHKISLGNYDKKKLKEQNCSDELKDLIEKSLIVDRNKRITSDEILQHKWFKLFTKNPDYNTVLSPDIINALKNFQNQNVLQKEILYYLAKISTESEVVKLREAFSLIDEDNSGEIEYNDIPKVFQSLGIQATDEELKKIFDSLDFHHDGKVNYCEFIAATLSSIKFARKERLRSAFRYFDVSDQGYITADGIVEVLKKTKHIVNKDELIKIFSGLKGQKIEYEEFKKIFYETKAIPT
jgi:Ca2+-binding EF-hand superfamily protein